MKRVSIIIPTKNRLQLLLKTLENIFNQSYKDIEIIVVDDASEDGTLEYLQTYLSERVKAIPNKRKGPGAARNTGLEIATGAFIKFFDSDDVMTLNCIEDQSEKLQESGADFVYGSYVHAIEASEGIWKQKDVILQYYPLPKPNSLLNYMSKGFFMVIPSCMFKRGILNKVGFWREDIVAYEDWDFLWRLALLKPKMIHSAESAMFYRLHGEQTTGNKFSNAARDRDKIKCLENLPRLPAIGQDSIEFEKYLLKTKLYQTKRELDNIPLNLLYEGGLLYLKIYSKINRMQTKSIWSVAHGINRNEHSFEIYNSLLLKLQLI